jgi:6-pyruvoyltetrahydropterin/6-carboxytetrahydropterin synthase
MAFEVEVARTFRARQGLPSPIRARRGLTLLAPDAEITVVLRVAVTFDDSQLTDRGWFVDTDALAEQLAEWVGVLSDGPWTARFPFRPTFELVARHVYGELSGAVAQLAWVELEDRAFGSRTRYRPG